MAQRCQLTRKSYDNLSSDRAKDVGYEDGLFPDVEAAREHRRTVVSSDAHYLWDIAESGHEFEPGDDAISRLILASMGKRPL